MGGTGSSRHVCFDEERVQFVKGIRLSERVIDRMKESSLVVRPQASTKSSTQPPTSPPEAPQVERLRTPASGPAVVLSDKMPSTGHNGPCFTEGPPVEEHVRHPFFKPMGSFSPTPQTQTTVNKEELQKLLKDEANMSEIKIRQQLDEERTKGLQEEVQKVQEEQKTSSQQTLADAFRMEQLKLQDERLIAQYYWMERKAQKLEEKEKDLLNQETLFQEQIAKLQKQTAQFSKVTAESYRKGLEDTRKRFRSHRVKPVCADLHNQILTCYAENKGQTLTCSSIASLYIQCVDNAKQGKALS